MAMMEGDDANVLYSLHYWKLMTFADWQYIGDQIPNILNGFTMPPQVQNSFGIGNQIKIQI